MADARRFDANENVVSAGLRHGHVVKFQRATLMDKADGFHAACSVGDSGCCVHSPISIQTR
jgi:hypothetical protein